MKREIRNAITKAIKESDLNGYKWTITEHGLKWSYGEEFTFDTTSEENILMVRANSSRKYMAVIWYKKDDKFADCKTLVEAYYLATKATIRKANRIY